jgi:hypothetical protein
MKELIDPELVENICKKVDNFPICSMKELILNKLKAYATSDHAILSNKIIIIIMGIWCESRPESTFHDEHTT